jgi:uncharacterized protein (DUF305 family)
MVLFSRSFVRKRLISLATTASVAATSLALAEDPTRTDHVRETMPIQHEVNRPDHSQEQSVLPENCDAINRMMADITVKRTGNADCDSISMIVPHHEATVDMQSRAQMSTQLARIDGPVTRGGMEMSQ